MTDEATVEAVDVVDTEQASTEAATAEVNTTEESTSANDWRGEIKDEKLREFAGRFTTPEEMAKTALQFRQKLSNAITLPGKDASEDDIKEYYTKLGVPATAAEYGIVAADLPEGVDVESVNAELAAMADAMHKAGATPAAAKAAAEARLGALRESAEANSERQAKVQDEQEAQLRKKWGKEYDTNHRYAERGFTQFAGETGAALLEKEIDGVRIGDHPVFLELFANIGRKMGEGGLHTVMDESDKATTEDKMNELTEKAHAARARGDIATSNRLFKERETLSASFYGN